MLKPRDSSQLTSAAEVSRSPLAETVLVRPERSRFALAMLSGWTLFNLLWTLTVVLLGILKSDLLSNAPLAALGFVAMTAGLCLTLWMAAGATAVTATSSALHIERRLGAWPLHHVSLPIDEVADVCIDAIQGKQGLRYDVVIVAQRKRYKITTGRSHKDAASVLDEILGRIRTAKADASFGVH